MIGGGNSAGQAAVFLAGHARHVHILVRGRGLADTMSRYLIQRIETAPNITLHAETEIVALGGEEASSAELAPPDLGQDRRATDRARVRLYRRGPEQRLAVRLRDAGSEIVREDGDRSCPRINRARPVGACIVRLSFSKPACRACSPSAMRRSVPVKRVAAAVGEVSPSFR